MFRHEVLMVKEVGGRERDQRDTKNTEDIV